MNTITKQTPSKINFDIMNQLVCNSEDFDLSMINLFVMYIYLLVFFKSNNKINFDQFLNETNYFNKIIFLKYLLFFRKFNELKFRVKEEDKLVSEVAKKAVEDARLSKEAAEEVENNILNVGNAILRKNAKKDVDETIPTNEENVDDINVNKMGADESRLANEEAAEAEENAKKAVETARIYNEMAMENTRITSTFQDSFKEKTLNLLKSYNLFTSDLNKLFGLEWDTHLESIINTLFDDNNTIIHQIYEKVIENIYEKFDENLQAYKILFNVNQQNPMNSSETASFFIGFHGGLFVINDTQHNNLKYLTINSPVNTTINRWGTRGDPTFFFDSMKYTFKQCLIRQPQINKQTADECFDLLGTQHTSYNYRASQTTSACANYTDEQTDTYPNNIIRIKHYSTDSTHFMLFDNYKIPKFLNKNLMERIVTQCQNNFTNPECQYSLLLNEDTQFNTAENIIALNFLLFTNNIEFSVFNGLNMLFSKDKTTIDPTIGLYPKIGLYTRDYQIGQETLIKSTLISYHFHLDIFSFNKPAIFVEDFVLERDIYSLQDIHIKLRIGGKDVNFQLEKGESFVCNPYIIQYFIEKFQSKITIRPGYILSNIDYYVFRLNKQHPTTLRSGSTITCPSKGLSCYKVTLALLTNYEILQFCKDAQIQNCNLYDTSCQSFMYIDYNSNIISKTDIDEPTKLKAKKMGTLTETSVLSNYDNKITQLLLPKSVRGFNNFNFKFEPVIGKRKFGTGGMTKRRTNKKKISRKQKTTKNANKKRQRTKKIQNRKPL